MEAVDLGNGCHITIQPRKKGLPFSLTLGQIGVDYTLFYKRSYFRLPPESQEKIKILKRGRGKCIIFLLWDRNGFMPQSVPLDSQGIFLPREN